MLKVMILCLLSASFATAGFFTPTTDKHGVNPDTAAVKEGHSVVIELEEGDGNTKVSVSPKDSTGYDDKISGKMEETKEKIKDAAASVDGKVKDTIERVKEGLSSTGKNKVEDIKESVVETAKRAKEEAERKVEGVKEKAMDTTHQYSARTKEEGKKELKGLFGYFKMLSRVCRALASVVYLMGLAVAYGMCVWVTFGSSRVLTGTLPRLQLLMVQTKIQPVYFRAMVASVGAALVGYWMGQRSRRGMLGGLDLAASLAMVLANMLYVEPRSSKVLLERMRKEKEEGITAETTREETTGEKKKDVGESEKPRGQIVGRVNMSSSLLNMGTLLALTWHLVRLAHQLQSQTQC